MPEKRKIVIIGSAYPLRGGLSAYNERLARAYLQSGDEVIIYTFSLQYPNFLFPGKTQYSTDPAPTDLDIRVKINSVNPLNWIWIGQEIKELKPDLVIIKFWIPFMAPCLGTIARFIRKNKHSKIVSIIDNIIPHEKRPGDRWLGNYWVKSVDGFVVMSKSVLNDLDIFDKQKPKLFCPHPLYDHFGEIQSKAIARKSLSLDEDSKYILFFGFIRDYKGLDLLLNAMADERIRNLKIKLLVAGEFYTNSKPYFEIIKKNNLEESVIMSNDFISDSDVAKYFSACDIVVQPYKDATQSGVTQIAFHFNKPMITTNVGGLAEIVPDGKVGYVVEPNIKEIADAIVKFYKEEKEAEFSANVKIEKEKYSWERMTETIDRLLLETNNKRT
jgi:glycosyltransferase involved in cell wall biosynthesis